MPRGQVRNTGNFGRDIELVKVFGKCGICLVDDTQEIYFPFRSPPDFSRDREDLDSEDSIEVCFVCAGRIMKIRRSNAEAFAECITIQDVGEVVRKAFRL